MHKTNLLVILSAGSARALFLAILVGFSVAVITLSGGTRTEAASTTLVPNFDKASAAVWQAAPGFVTCGSGSTTSTCAEHIDDDVDGPSDSSDIRIQAANQTSEAADFELTNMPYGGTFVSEIGVRYIARTISGTGATLAVEVRLANGTPLLARSESIVATSNTEYSYTVANLSLTQAQVDGLYVHIVASTNNNTALNVSAVNLEIAYNEVSLFPVADISNTSPDGWMDEGGVSCASTTTTCTPDIDDIYDSPSRDNDLILTQSAAPNDATASFDLSNVPAGTTGFNKITVKFRAHKVDLGLSATIRVEIVLGSTVLGSPPTSETTSEFSDYSYTITGLNLTESQANSLVARVIGDGGQRVYVSVLAVVLQQPAPTPTPTLSPTPSPSQTASPTPTATPTPTPTPTPSPTPSPLPDYDGDGVPNASDNCPSWPNPGQDLPPWPVPANDPDCDGFDDATEAYIGTEYKLHCWVGAGADAWPPDLYQPPNGTISISDVLALKPVYNQSVPPAPVRYDFNQSGTITLTDVLALKPFYNQTCTP